MICVEPDQRVSPPASVTMATSDEERKHNFWKLLGAPWLQWAALWGAGLCPPASQPQALALLQVCRTQAGISLPPSAAAAAGGQS